MLPPAGGILADFNKYRYKSQSYEPWLASRWGIDQSARRNESQKFISAQSLSADDLDYLHRISEEDTKLYQHVSERLRVAGGVSIRID